VRERESRKRRNRYMTPKEKGREERDKAEEERESRERQITHIEK
jgi:hypothetical protein